MNILLDENGDWAVTDNQLQLVTGVEEIAQIVATRLKFYLGEWFMDVRKGVPWFSKILKKGANPSEVEAILTQAIVDSPGIITLNEATFSLDNQTRRLTVEFNALSTEGILNFSEVVP